MIIVFIILKWLWSQIPKELFPSLCSVADVGSIFNKLGFIQQPGYDDADLAPVKNSSHTIMPYHRSEMKDMILKLFVAKL